MQKQLSLFIMIAVTTLALGIGCGKKRHKFTAEQGSASTEQDGSGLLVDVDWVKNKRDSIDVLVYLKNTYGEPVVIPTKAYKVTYHGKTYGLRGPSTLEEFAPNTTEKKVLIFRTGEEIPKKGTVTLTIDPINQGEAEKVGKKLKPIKLELPLE